ncbi:MAG: C4-dicarboxylate ABC transporter [Proteobacteria bacterium TMED72]|nr:MAG: C4-dicarboxylate ABC transporter [Proteobacteria bacterium TMED72]
MRCHFLDPGVEMISRYRKSASTFILLAALLVVPTVEALTLKIATIVPDGSSWLVEMRKAGKEIAKETDGRVKLKFYPGGVMGGDKTVLRKIRARQLQGGAFTSGALAEIFPDIELYSLPLIFRNYEEVDFVRAAMDEQLKKGMAEQGLEVLSISDGGFAYVMSQVPIRRVEDLKGMKVWLVEDDKMTEVALDAAGVSPVPLPIADVYTALQTGLVDTVAAPPMGAIAFQWHTKVGYLTDVPLMYLTGVLAVDKRAFDKISPADRKVVRETIKNVARGLDEEGRQGEMGARQALQNQGIEFVTAESEEEVLRWHQMSEEAIKNLRGMNRYSDENMDQVLTLLEQYRSERSASQ